MYVNKTEVVTEMDNKKPAFTISEFGKQARVSVRTLRYYEEIGLLVPMRKNSSGHRLYGLIELAKLQQIQSLKFLGYSLQEIKDLMGNNANAFVQLEKSLPLQLKLLTEKRDELNRSIEAVEHVQKLLSEEKPITWTVLSSLLFQMEHEEDQKKWIKEYFSDDEMANNFFSLSKEQRQQLDVEMLEWLISLKQLMKEGASPQSSEAFDILIRLTEMATRHVDSKEELADQIEKAQESMKLDRVDFKFPTFLTPEEETFLEEIGKEMESQYNQEIKDSE